MVWLKRIALSVAILVVGLILAAWWKPLPGEALTPAGIPRNSSVYVAAADGTRIALDLWLPAGLAPGERIPALVEGSRYWRGLRVTLAGRLLNLLGQNAPGAQPDGYPRYFTDRGYAYVKVEVRGTGASFGVHQGEYSPQEMADYGAILDWIVRQPWSNGRTGAVGISYAGTTAELMTTTAHPSLKAAAPLFSDFDAQYHLVTPGGIYQPTFVQAWSRMVLAMDANDICTVAGATGTVECLITRLLVGGIKPVDGPEGKLLDAAVAEHDSPDPTTLVQGMKYRDSPWGPSGYSSLDSQPYARRAEIEASGVPMYIMAGWLDAATADGALARFAGFSNPQTVVIGPFSHGGGHDTDPFRETDAPPVWPYPEQLRRLEAFFARHLKSDGEPAPRQLTYYVMGGERWRTTDRWPPAGFQMRRYHLATSGRLLETPETTPGSTGYQVDWNTGTAPRTRWMTQLSGDDVVYDARNAHAAGAAVFVTEPFQAPMELTGTVTVELILTTDTPDGAVHAYLDLLAPDGSARYLTEGVIRLRHRRVSPEPPLYPHFGPYHSFLARDAAEMPAGRPEPVSLGLYATSARIPAGHRLRLSLTGADATSFARVPAEGPAPRWRIHHGGATGSRLTVPLRPWD